MSWRFSFDHSTCTLSITTMYFFYRVRVCYCFCDIGYWYEWKAWPFLMLSELFYAFLSMFSTVGSVFSSVSSLALRVCVSPRPCHALAQVSSSPCPSPRPGLESSDELQNGMPVLPVLYGILQCCQIQMVFQRVVFLLSMPALSTIKTSRSIAHSFIIPFSISITSVLPQLWYDL